MERIVKIPADKWDEAIALIEASKPKETITHSSKGKVAKAVDKPYTSYNPIDLTIVADDFVEQILLINSTPYTVNTDYDLWKLRVEIVNTLRVKAEESPLSIPADSFYEKHQQIIKDYIESGSKGLLEVFESSTDKWLDMRENDDPLNSSPRETAITLLS